MNKARDTKQASLKIKSSAGMNGVPGKITTTVIFTACLSLILLSGSGRAFAQVKLIAADSTYVMKKNDNKLDARRIAVQNAKRNALELAGSYLETLTEIKNNKMTRGEVKAYAAGIIEAEIIADEMRGTAEHPEVYIQAHCRIDTGSIIAQINRYRENEDLEDQLKVSWRESDKLRRKRDVLIKQLAGERDKAKAEATRRKLATVLAEEEANEETGKIWRRLAFSLNEDDNVQEISQAELDTSTSILERALAINPRNQRARSLLAALYSRKGNYVSAERELRAAVQRNPSNPGLHTRLGMLLRVRGNNKEALKEFRFVERLRPREPLMLFYAGITLKELNHCGSSIQYLQRFLKNTGSSRFPGKKEQAVQMIKDCGGARGGYQQRVRYGNLLE